MTNQARTRHAVVCGTDFTDCAAGAAGVAAALAAALELPLLLIHASGEAGHGPSASRTLRALMKSKREDLRSEAGRLKKLGATVIDEVHVGHPDEVLIARAGECDARLIVLGSLGTRSGSRHRVGSVAERTAEAAPVPTLVIRSAAPFRSWLRGERPLGIFVGFDFTATAEAALDLVLELRRAGPCDVTVGYANWPDERERMGFAADPAAEHNPEPVQQALEHSLRGRVTESLGEDAGIIVRAARGRADFTLIEMAAERKADLLIAGTHQRQGLPRLLAPSVSRGLLHHAPISVATVPAAQSLRKVPPVPDLRRILVATDFSPLGNRALAHAFAIARPGGIVRVVHVVHPLALPGGEFEAGLGAGPQHARHVVACGRRLKNLIPVAAGAIGCATEMAVVEDEDPAAGIRREAERFGADVIVMGSQGRSALGRVVLGSVAQSVMASSSRPVFIVRAPKA